MENNSTNINNDISHQIIEHRKEPNIKSADVNAGLLS
jgi:hypothetical protein